MGWLSLASDKISLLCLFIKHLQAPFPLPGPGNTKLSDSPCPPPLAPRVCGNTYMALLWAGVRNGGTGGKCFLEERLLGKMQVGVTTRSTNGPRAPTAEAGSPRATTMPEFMHSPFFSQCVHDNTATFLQTDALYRVPAAQLHSSHKLINRAKI